VSDFRTLHHCALLSVVLAAVLASYSSISVPGLFLAALATFRVSLNALRLFNNFALRNRC
jgi:hypothetical protein